MRHPTWHPRLALAIALAVAANLSCGEDLPPLSVGIVHVDVAGPITGGEVTAIAVDPDGVRGEVLATGQTDSAGHVDLEVAQARGEILLEVTGGATTEYWSTETLTLDGSVQARAALTGFELGGEVTVAITPVTTMGAALAERRLALGKEMTYGAAVDRAHALLGAHFFDIDPLAVIPADVTDDALAGTSLTEPVRYGLALAAMSALSRRMMDNETFINTFNSIELARAWADDLSSAEGLFDGAGAGGALRPGTCVEPSDCAGDECLTLCDIDANTPRAKLAIALAVDLINSSNNGADLAFDEIQELAIAMADNTEPELFPTDVAPEALDTEGPVITWVSPQTGNIIDGLINLEITANDVLSNVVSLTAEIDGASAPDDQDSAAERYFGAGFDTNALPEGGLTMRATARDSFGNESMSEIAVSVNNADPGSISGVVIKGPVSNADVTAYRFDDGTYGNALGGATTDVGVYGIVDLSEGYSGPILIEAGGAGTYQEESWPTPQDVAFDTSDYLRTIVLYTDGNNVNNVVVTPITSLAVTYTEHLLGLEAGPIDADAVTNAWNAAVAAIAEHFDLPNITSQWPADPASITTFSSAARYTLALIGLSQMAFNASNDGGGDAGSWGAVMNALAVWHALDNDLSDGCFDGYAGATPLNFGTAPLGPDTARIELANAIVDYLVPGTENVTPFGGPGDILPLLDALASSGPSDGTDGCANGELFDEPGSLFDQDPPVITWADGPDNGAVVRGALSLSAEATDLLAMTNVVTTWVAPAALVGTDTDGDLTDNDANALLDTTALGDGAVAISVQAEDLSTNVATSTRNVTVDNTPPEIVVGGVTNGGIYPDNQVVTFSQTDANPGTTTATLNGMAFSSGTLVSVEDDYVLSVTATDLPGNTAGPLNVQFAIDKTAPALNVSGVSDGSYYNTDVTVAFSQSDAHPGTTTATLNGSAFTSGTTVAAEGDYTLVVDGTDAAGNAAATVTMTFTIDKTPPIIEITGVADGVVYPNDRLITFSQNDVNAGSVTATLNGSAFSSGTLVSAEDDYVLNVTASDLAGNMASAVTVSFGIDKTAPEINVSGVIEGTYYNTNVTIAFSQTDAHAGATTATLNGSAFASGTTVTAEGDYTLVVNATDAAGNAADPVTVTFTVDKTDPVITVAGVSDGVWYDAPVTISYSQTDANEGTLSATVDGLSFVSSGTVNADGAHQLIVSAIDLAGNSATETIDFFVDQMPPVIAETTNTASWSRGMLTVSVQATDALSPIGSLPDAIAVTATGPAGDVTSQLSLVANTIMGGTRTLSATIDTTAGPFGGDGMFSLAFTIDDAAGHTGALVVVTNIDNTPPVVTLDRLGSGPTLDFTSDTTPAITGTISTGGSPVTVTVTVDSGIPVAATLNGDGTWTYDMPGPLAEGSHSVSVSAADAAGNTSNVASGGFTVDTMGPVLTWQASPFDQENAYALDFSGPPPVCYNGTDEAGTACTGIVDPLVTVDLTSSPQVYKFVTRMDTPADSTNPIVYRASASDGMGGVGLADEDASVQYRVYRDGQTPPAWRDGTSEGPNGLNLLVAGYALASVQPELATHTGTFHIDMRAIDQLGNVGTTTSSTWDHHPLAPPVNVYFAGEAPAVTDTAGELWAHSIHRASLDENPNDGDDVAMRDAIQKTVTTDGLALYKVENPHGVPVSVRLFLPAPANATWTRRIREANPWRGSLMTTGNGGANWVNDPCDTDFASDPSAVCPGGLCILSSVSYRLNPGWTFPPTGSEATCNGPGWSAPADTSDQIIDTVDADLAASDLTLRAFDGANEQTLTPAGGGWDIDVPANTVLTIMVSLDDMAMWNPLEAPLLGGDIEEDELYTGRTITGTIFTDEWADCATSVLDPHVLNNDPTPPLHFHCTDIERRQHYRALVEALVDLPDGDLFLNGRTRATLDAAFEIQPEFADSDVFNLDTPLRWHTCEGTIAGSTCTLNVPTLATPIPE